MKQMNKTIWITGASSGIGRSLALVYGKDPVNLILSARSESKLDKVKNEIGNPERIRVLPLDLTESESFPEIVEKAWGMFNGIDIMIHNGGISQRSLVAETPLSVDRSIFETNYFGTVGLTKCLLPYFRQRGSGHFVVITSVVGKFGTALRSSYSGSKHALHGFFESLRAEHYEDNIQVSLICPGFVNTSVSINALTADGSKQGTKDKATAGGLPPDVFAHKARRAISRQKREAIIGGPLEVIAVYIKRFFPGIHSRMIRKAAVT
ncbi:MAG: SDR family NAD(P)-dependent oxidoreductase [Lutimonas sp.]